MAFVNNTFIFYDIETISANPHRTQPIQLAAVAIHSSRLTIIPNSEFESMIYAVEDPEECQRLGLDEIQDEALAVNNKTRDEIKNAPKIKEVWSQFVDYVNNYNYTKNDWGSPIPCSFNGNGFDDIIIDRICGPHGYGLGPWNEKRSKQSLFHPIYNIDLFKIVFSWFSATAEPKRLNMDSLRDFFGLSTDKTHDALFDVQQGADLLCRFLKLQRSIGQKINWQNKKG